MTRRVAKDLGADKFGAVMLFGDKSKHVMDQRLRCPVGLLGGKALSEKLREAPRDTAKS